MRLHQYLINESGGITLTEDELVDTITKGCSQWLKESNGIPVYRGIVNPPKTGVDKLMPRTDRRPRDTNIDLHMAIDEGLNDRFGWKPRSEGVFVTGDIKRANKYGFEHVIFPVNGYKYIWSPKVDDLYVALTRIDNPLLGVVDKFLYIFADDSDKSAEWLQSKQVQGAVKSYRDTDLVKAIKSKNEIIVKCESYYIVESSAYEKIKGRLT